MKKDMIMPSGLTYSKVLLHPLSKTLPSHIENIWYFDSNQPKPK